MKPDYCDRAPRGYYCNKLRDHVGPCPLWPRWWAHPGLWLLMKRRA